VQHRVPKEWADAFARLVVLPNDQQLVAQRSIVAGTDVAHPAIADIKSFDNGEAKGPGTLDDTATHAVRINQRLLLEGYFEGTIDVWN
jgi:hypothetical protein